MRLGVREAARASLNIYSTKQEIDALLDGLSAARRNARNRNRDSNSALAALKRSSSRLRFKQVSHRRVRLWNELLAQGRLFLSLNRLH
jgi:hypothetical protein